MWGKVVLGQFESSSLVFLTPVRAPHNPESPSQSAYPLSLSRFNLGSILFGFEYEVGSTLPLPLQTPPIFNQTRLVIKKETKDTSSHPVAHSCHRYLVFQHSLATIELAPQPFR